MERFPNAFVIGESIYLRHPTEEDARGPWHAWLSDPETTRYLGAQRWPNTVERQIEFLKSLTPYGSRMALAIVVKENHRHIGIASLSRIHYIDRSAYIAVLIGEPDCRTGPYGLESYNLILEVAFLKLNLRMVLSSSVADHAAVHAIHERCGFREKGRIEKQLWVDGRYCDNVISAVTQDEWLESNPKRYER